MLRELSVRNLVIVAEARLEAGEGLIAITGETGAGKSLLLDALDLLAGARGGADLVGPHGEACDLCADFALAPERVQAITEAAGLPPAEEGVLVLRRRLRRDGRSQAWINDTPVSIAGLRQAAAQLIAIQAQDRAAALCAPAAQLAALDQAGGHAALAAAYADAHARVLALAAERQRLEGEARGGRRELDFLRFQLAELEALAPRRGEYEALTSRQRLLAEAGRWQELCAEAQMALAEDERAVLRTLGRLARALSEAPHPALRDAATSLESAAEAVREAVRACAAAADRLHADPGELAAVEARLDAYHALMRKHGEGEEALFQAQAGIAARLAELSGLDERLQQLMEELSTAEGERARLGRELAEARRRAFPAFAEAVQAVLASLGMPRARLVLAEDARAAPGPLGTVAMELHLQTNPGLPAGPLAEVASGGERSRLLLAVSSVLAARSAPPLLVFDEIDSGVGGRLGGAVADALQRLAAERTVLVVTHTAQVAARARRHYAVRKRHEGERTTVTVEPLDGAARRQELADMLGGGAAALAQAEALMEAAHG